MDSLRTAAFESLSHQVKVALLAAAIRNPNLTGQTLSRGEDRSSPSSHTGLRRKLQLKLAYRPFIGVAGALEDGCTPGQLVAGAPAGWGE